MKDRYQQHKWKLLRRFKEGYTCGVLAWTQGSSNYLREEGVTRQEQRAFEEGYRKGYFGAADAWTETSQNIQ